jgi:hypothetical protein
LVCGRHMTAAAYSPKSHRAKEKEAGWNVALTILERPRANVLADAALYATFKWEAAASFARGGRSRMVPVRELRSFR